MITAVATHPGRTNIIKGKESKGAGEGSREEGKTRVEEEEEDGYTADGRIRETPRYATGCGQTLIDLPAGDNFRQ